MEDKKLKVLMLGKQVIHYRVPILNILSQYFDLTVAYTLPVRAETLEKCTFPTIFLQAKKLSKLSIHTDNIYELCNKYDVVVAYGQATYLKYSLLSLRKKRKFKLIYWGIGVPASYTRKYDQGSSFIKWITYQLKKGADALVFYTDYPKKTHAARGYKLDAMFVANNTVEVDKIKIDNSKKDCMMFIGTLYMQKGINILLGEYEKAYKENNDILPLKIVGGGQDFELAQKWIKEHGLTQKISLLGPVFDAKQKAEIFSTAMICISPNQAGLSVLESMGYGVPYVTTKDAITGGEIFNIKNGVTGVLMEDCNELSNVIINVSTKPNRFFEMGEKAYSYYWENRQPKDMAQGIIDAVEYVINH